MGLDLIRREVRSGSGISRPCPSTDPNTSDNSSFLNGEKSENKRGNVLRECTNGKVYSAASQRSRYPATTNQQHLPQLLQQVINTTV